MSNATVFISHDTDGDGKIAQRLARDLQADGIGVWIAPESIDAGESWPAAIDRGLATATHFLLVASPTALRSPWVRAEVDAALVRENDSSLEFLVSETETTQLSPLLRTKQLVPLQNYDKGFEKLRAGIRVDEPPTSTLVCDDITAFVGHTERGPHSPQLVGTFDEFRQIFGETPASVSFMSLAVAGFFSCGGRLAYVVRVSSREALPARAELPLGTSGIRSSASVPVLEMRAENVGAWGDRLRIRLGTGTRAGYRLEVMEDGMGRREDFDNVSFDPSGPNPIMEVIKSRSSLLRLKLAGDPKAVIPPDELRARSVSVDLQAGTDVPPATPEEVGKALQKLDDFQDIGILCVPDHVQPSYSSKQRRAITEMVVARCEETLRFGFLSVPRTSDAITEISNLKTSFAAAFAPWLRIAGGIENELSRHPGCAERNGCGYQKTWYALTWLIFFTSVIIQSRDENHRPLRLVHPAWTVPKQPPLTLPNPSISPRYAVFNLNVT